MAELDAIEKQQNDIEQQTQTLSLGAALETARLAKSLTQQDVSNSLRYSVKQVDALEKNAFDLLPDAMITRGFIRNYARLLEIDAEPLLQIYRDSVSTETGKKITVQSSMRPVQLTKESQPWLKYILASILVLLFLLAWFFYIEYMPKTANVEIQKAPEVVADVDSAPTVVEPLPEIALPAAQREFENSATAVGLPADPNVAANATNSGVVTVAEIKPQDAATTSDVKTLPQPAQAPVSQGEAKPVDKSLSMIFTAQTWVSITDKSGKVIFEKMARNGDHETINALPPLNVVIGNASATKLTFGGKDVDLVASTKNNVARITLE